MFRIFSSLENHKLHKSAHPSIQGKSDITTPLVLVKKSTKPWVNCLENHSLSGNYDGKDEPKNPAQWEPLAERLWFFILTDFVPIETHMSSACDFFSRRHPCLSWIESFRKWNLRGFSVDCVRKLTTECFETNCGQILWIEISCFHV